MTARRRWLAARMRLFRRILRLVDSLPVEEPARLATPHNAWPAIRRMAIRLHSTTPTRLVGQRAGCITDCRTGFAESYAEVRRGRECPAVDPIWTLEYHASELHPFYVGQIDAALALTRGPLERLARPWCPLPPLYTGGEGLPYARYGGSLTSYAKREAYAAKRLYLMPTTQQ